MITICGYLDSLQNFVNYSLSKSIHLKDQDKKDFTKIFAQVPKRKPLIKNFSEDDPRIPKIQNVIFAKIAEKIEVNNKKNFINKEKNT
jgi:hypothetical protein